MSSQPVGSPSMLLSALWYSRQGIDVFPLWWPEGGRCACPAGADCPSPAKHPMTHAGFKDASSDEEQVKTWWAKWPTANIGVPTGSQFDVVDIDGATAAWKAFVATHGEPEHVGFAMSGRNSGGFHLYCTPGGLKTIPSGKNGLPPGVEIKANGGYVVAPPSMHVSGNAYQWIKPLSDAVVYGTVPYRDWYAALAPKPERPRVDITPTIPVAEDRASRYGAAVLAKACDAITSVGPDGGRWNALALEAVPLAARAVAGGCLNRAAAIRALEQAAAQSGLTSAEVARVPELFSYIELQGITDPIAPGPDPSEAVDSWLASLPSTSLPPAYVEESDTRARTSWWPRDLASVISGDDPEPDPTVLARDDGKHLFYPGKVNGIIGESESGKTWVALLAVKQQLDAGGRVLYLDFEDTAPGIVSRLRLMGVHDGALAGLSYVGPDESLHALASADLTEHLHAFDPALIVLDGFNAAMTLMGLDLNSNTDATRFSQSLLKPLARSGACLVYVDHVPKNRDARGKGGIGAQAKRAMTTGCALSVDVVNPFGRGMTGMLRLTVDKDRPGKVRAVSALARHAGTATLASAGDSVVISIEPAPDLLTGDTKEAIDQEELRDKVLTWLQSKPHPQTTSAIRNGVRKRKESVIEAIQSLVWMGAIRIREDGRYEVVDDE